MKLLNKIMLSGCLYLLPGSPAAAQFTLDHSNYSKGTGFVTDVTGRRPNDKAYDRIIDGSPWWFDYFMEADLAGENGTLYRNIPVKIDLLADKVFYRDATGATMELLTPVRYLLARPPGGSDTLKLVRAAYFTAQQNGGITGWLQLHIEGEATLLQQMGKQMQENKPLGSATTEYSIANRYTWVVLLDGSLVPVKKVKDLQELLAKRKPALLTYKGKQKGFDAQVKELVLAYNRM